MLQSPSLPHPPVQTHAAASAPSSCDPSAAPPAYSSQRAASVSWLHDWLASCLLSTAPCLLGCCSCCCWAASHEPAACRLLLLLLLVMLMVLLGGGAERCWPEPWMAGGAPAVHCSPVQPTHMSLQAMTASEVSFRLELNAVRCWRNTNSVCRVQLDKWCCSW